MLAGGPPAAFPVHVAVVCLLSICWVCVALPLQIPKSKVDIGVLRLAKKKNFILVEEYATLRLDYHNSWQALCGHGLLFKQDIYSVSGSLIT